MSGSKKTVNSILAIVMTFALLMAMIPMQAVSADDSTDPNASTGTVDEPGTGSLNGEANALTGDYTLIVKSGTDIVEGALVSYTISGKLQANAQEETVVLTGEDTTDLNGEIVLDLTDYGQEISSDNPFTLTYSISCEGYADVTDAVEDISYYTGTCTLEVVRMYTVSVSCDTGKGSLSYSYIDVNGEEQVITDGSSSEVASGTEITVSATAANSYQISSVSIGDSVQTLSDPYSFTSGTYIVSEGDTLISVEYVAEYTVTITYDGNGSVSTEPVMTESGESVAGVVTVTEGTDVSVTATPENGYHVSAVTIREGDGESVEQKTTLDENGNETAFVEENDCDWKGILEDVGSTYEVTVTFAANTYDVTIRMEGGSEACTAAPSAEQVKYEDGVDVILTWEDGYYISDVAVSRSNLINDNSNGGDAWSYDSTDYEYTEGEDTLTIHINDIKADITVEVTYASGEDVSSAYTVTTPLRQYSEKDEQTGKTVEVYIYGNNETATICLTGDTGYSWISESGEETGESKKSNLSYSSNKAVETLYFGMTGQGTFGSVVYWTVGDPAVKLVFDTVAPNDAEIVLDGTSSTTEEGVVYYSGNVDVTVDAEESETSYSGLASVVYWMDSEEEPENATSLYNYESDAGDILSSATYGFTIENDNANHILHVKVTDRAGNSSEALTAVNFCATGIVVSMSGDKSEEAADGAYYNSVRTAEIRITERSDSFNPDGLEVTNNEENGPAITVSWGENVSSDSDVVTYVAKLTFSEEGTYDWSFTYTNLAGFVYDSVKDAATSVTSVGENVYWFIYDVSNPVGYITINDKPFVNPDNESGYYSEQLSTLSFMYFAQMIQTAEATAADEVSGVQAVTYYKSDSTEALTAEQLTQLDASAFSSSVYWSEAANESIVIYARIVDNAGNVAYVSSDGTIIDSEKPEITLSLEGANENGWYGGDAAVTFIMNDTDSIDIVDSNGETVTKTDTSSGIERVEYAVYKAYYTDSSKRTDTGSIDLTAEVKLEQVESLSGTYYASDIDSEGTDSYDYNENTGALTEWTSGLTITKTTVNDADYIIVEATVYDNAGNESETVRQVLSADITSPSIHVFYDNNDAENGMYFDATRTATIEVNERADGFAAENTVITITAVDAEGNAVTGSTQESDSESNTSGISNLITILDADGNELSEDSYVITMDSTGTTGTIIVYNWSITYGEDPDQDIQTIQIVYQADANYTFAIETKDKAGNSCSPEEVSYEEGTTAPETFTVDQTIPTGYVTINERSFFFDEEMETDWKQPYSPLLFGYWIQQVNHVYVTSHDVTSNVNDALTVYYKSDETYTLTAEQLDAYYVAGEFSDTVVVSDITNQSFVVYARITDYAGNYAYVSSNGSIADDIKPTIMLTPDDANENGWYNGDVFVTFTMQDEDSTSTENADGTIVSTLNMSSGIERVEYAVYQAYYTDGSKRNSTDTVDQTADVELKLVESLSGTYYASDISDASAGSDTALSCVYNENTDMLTDWTAGITVSADLVNNADYVLVEAAVYDHAGNVSDKAEQILSVDTTDPVISVSYDNNNVINGKYFDATRTATIEVNERADGFVAENTVITISAEDAYGDAVTDTYGNAIDMNDWITVLDADGNALDASDYMITMNEAGTSGTLVVHNWSVNRGNTPDLDIQTIRILYQADANYTFSIETADQAENTCSFSGRL